MFHSTNERKERGDMSIEINFPEKILRRMNFSDKYFSEAKELLKEGDYVQASEKLWERRHKWLRRLQRREI